MTPRQGVAENFIGILRQDERASGRALVRHALFFVLLVLVTGIAIDLPDGRMFGIGTGVVILALVAGVGLGLLFARFVTLRRFDHSLANGWNQWMRYSVACSRVDEVHRRVHGRPATRSTTLAATLWSLALFATMVLLLLTVLDGAPTLEKTPVFAAYGAYLGFLAGRTIALRIWVHHLLVSLDELVRKGEIGVWGIV